MATAESQDKESYRSLLEGDMYMGASLVESIAKLKTTLNGTREALTDTIDVLDNFLLGTIALIIVLLLLGIGVLYLLHRQITIIQHSMNKVYIQKARAGSSFRNQRDKDGICLKDLNESSHVNGDLKPYGTVSFNDEERRYSKYNHLYEECNRALSNYEVKPSVRPDAQPRTVRTPTSCSVTIENVVPEPNARKSQKIEHSTIKNNESDDGSYQTFPLDAEEAFYHTPSIKHNDRSSKYMSTFGLKDNISEERKLEETQEMNIAPNFTVEQTYDLPRPIPEVVDADIDDLPPPPEDFYSEDTYEHLKNFETSSTF